MAENHMPAPSPAPVPTPQHPSNAYDSPPSYAHAQAHLPPPQAHSYTNPQSHHIILPPIPAVESLSLDERPAQTQTSHTHSGSNGSMPHSHSKSNLHSHTHSHSHSSQSLPLPQPVEPPEPIQPRYHPPTSWPSSNPFVSYYQGPQAQAQPSQTQSSLNDSPRGVDSPGSMDIDREHRGNSVLSIDDPDVRMAAEALGDLRADFIQTPPNGQRHSSNGKRNSSNPRRSQPEPLLSLLTSHPLIGPAVNQSAAAYSAGKNYSPCFKSTAEYVERRVTPVVNRVSTVGRVTGVEGGVRWFLGGRRRHNRPRGNTSGGKGNGEQEQGAKRRKMRDDQDMGSSSRTSYASTYSYASANQPDHTTTPRDRRDSQASSMVESLPAYDDFTSPSYAESQTQQQPSQQQIVQREDYRDDNIDDSSWQRKLILSTSGLSIAMSDESLRSLKYCLTWLRWAGEHIGGVLAMLTGLLEQNQIQDSNETSGDMNRRVQELKAEVLKTLKDVVEIVSKYAGGALPENAKVLVRRHLTSLPARFKIAQEQSQSAEQSADASPRTSTDGATSPREGARRATLLAKEGMEMMNQVSGILDLTIVSAEEWRQKLGKGGDMVKEPVIEQPASQQTQQYPAIRQNEYNGDYRMGEAM